MRAQFIYEKFLEDSDPIEDLGIGLAKLKKEVIRLQLYHVLPGMSVSWKLIVENHFMLPENEIYYLGDNKENDGDYIDKIELKIKKSKKILEKEIITSGINNEICIFKLYTTDVDKIGTFEYKYDSGFEFVKQYVGTILSILEFKSNEYLK